MGGVAQWAPGGTCDRRRGPLSVENDRQSMDTSGCSSQAALGAPNRPQGSGAGGLRSSSRCQCRSFSRQGIPTGPLSLNYSEEEPLTADPFHPSAKCRRRPRSSPVRPPALPAAPHPKPCEASKSADVGLAWLPIRSGSQYPLTAKSCNAATRDAVPGSSRSDLHGQAGPRHPANRSSRPCRGREVRTTPTPYGVTLMDYSLVISSAAAVPRDFSGS